MFDKLKGRYTFSNYEIDPNKFRFRKVVRILALIFRFIRSCRLSIRKRKGLNIQDIEDNRSIETLNGILLNDKYFVTTGTCYKISETETSDVEPGLVVKLTECDVDSALQYFYKKVTLEAQRFVGESMYQKMSSERNGILYYQGRILASQKSMEERT